MDYISMNNKVSKITVIGAGNGGQAIAGHCAIMGYSVCLYNRNIEKHHSTVFSHKVIELYGAINGKGTLNCVTSDIEEAVNFADIILIATTATAHGELALKMAPFLREGQIIILNPGRTGGLLEFKRILCSVCFKKIYLAEAQTLIYACRKSEDGKVHIIGVKDRVLLASDTKDNTNYILAKLKNLYSCFYAAENVLQTSLENIGAIFHPCVILFNAAAIERGNLFYFYREMTPTIAEFIQKVDAERVEIGKAYGINLISATEWVSYAYPGIQGSTLCERMKNNPAYYDILAPTSIYTRQLMEDIPTGLYPMAELGKLAGVSVTLIDSIITICSSLLNIDFRKEGRSLSVMGIDNLTVSEIIKSFI